MQHLVILFRRECRWVTTVHQVTDTYDIVFKTEHGQRIGRIVLCNTVLACVNLTVR